MVEIWKLSFGRVFRWKRATLIAYTSSVNSDGRDRLRILIRYIKLTTYSKIIYHKFIRFSKTPLVLCGTLSFYKSNQYKFHNNSVLNTQKYHYIIIISSFQQPRALRTFINFRFWIIIIFNIYIVNIVQEISITWLPTARLSDIPCTDSVAIDCLITSKPEKMRYTCDCVCF